MICKCLFQTSHLKKKILLSSVSFTPQSDEAAALVLSGYLAACGLAALLIFGTTRMGARCLQSINKRQRANHGRSILGICGTEQAFDLQNIRENEGDHKSERI
ncbi:hypothetical protein PoB_005573400 [Plakobranchus ocellatus]|uniref:Uncharacterized protein n=1 Tax=Plakobranchus ocellatus TaxID=259542 RepID=A0AAV4CDL8_9GAST|nr:hypothetical protein PoB_005573400 [Plakobranchus ocellatus]